MNNLTEPLISNYIKITHKKIDNLINIIQPIANLSISQLNHLVLSIRTKIRKFEWDHNGNIFNHLASQWLIQNLPVYSKISSFEAFSKSLAFYKPFNITPETYERYLINFYKIALSVWIQLKEPSLDDVQLAVLEIVAKAINLNMKLERETFAQALYDILLVLINKKTEIITEDNFIKLMRNYMGILWKENPNYYKACSEYYEFAKHFILIDFPNKKHGYFKNFHAILQGKVAYFNDHILTILEKLTHKLYVRVVNRKKIISAEDFLQIETDQNNKQLNNIDFQSYLSQLIIVNSNFTRTKVLITQFFKISETLSIKYWNELKKYEIFQRFDAVLENLRVFDVANYGLDKIKACHFEIIIPNLDRVYVYSIAIKNSIFLKLENLKNLDMKIFLKTLKNKIEFLRESILIFHEKMIVMKFYKFSLERIYQKLKIDIIVVYKEVFQGRENRNEAENPSRSMILYENTLKFFQRKKENGNLKKNNYNGKNEEMLDMKRLEEILEESKDIIK